MSHQDLGTLARRGVTTGINSPGMRPYARWVAHGHTCGPRRLSAGILMGLGLMPGVIICTWRLAKSAANEHHEWCQDCVSDREAHESGLCKIISQRAFHLDHKSCDTCYSNDAPSLEVPHLRSIGPATRHQARAAWATHCLLHKRSVEDEGLPRELVGEWKMRL